MGDNQETPEAESPSGPRDTLPRRLGPYRIEARLGTGGMGEVFQGFDERLTRAVAIKWVHPAALNPSEEPEVARRRFRREARAAARINHPAVVQIYHVLELQDDGDAIVMELVDGQSLAQVLRAEQSLDLQRSIEIGLQVAAGLAEAHDKGIIHRDLKPANIMLTPSGQVKILDFGLATGLGVGADSDRLTRPGEAVGSFDMMSPEQARGEDVDPRSDLFSLGILMYLILTGQRPFWDATPLATVAQICREPHPNLRPLVPDAPQDLIDLIDQLLEKSPLNRPSDAVEVETRLSRIASVLGSVRAPAQTSGPALRALALIDLVDREHIWERLGDRRAGRWVTRLESLIENRLSAIPTSRRFELPEGSLFVFESPIEAVSLALEVHRRLRDWNQDDSATASEAADDVRAFAVIHFGDITLSPKVGDAGEEATAAELGPAATLLTSLAELVMANQTVLTRSAFDLSRSSAGQARQFTHLRWLAHGKFDIATREEPIGLFEVGEPAIAPFSSPPGRRRDDPKSGTSQTILGWRPATGQSLESHPNWRLTDRLRDGGFGEVWVAEHLKTGERRLFKFCFHEDRLRELQREITLFQILKDQLGERLDIARVLDWNFDEAPYFVESEYTEGGHLLDWIKKRGGCELVSLQQRLEIVAQVADALAAAHSVGVLHKDVEPRNILVQDLPNGDVQVRLADFGIGSLTDDAFVDPAEYSVLRYETDEDPTPGATLYRAPEVLEGRPATIQADIYALGVVLYQLTIGDLNSALGSGWERNVDDELLARDIAGAIDVSPTRRFGDATRLGQRLRHLQVRRQRLEDRRHTEAMAAEANLQLEKGRQRRRLALTVLSALLLISATMTWHQHRMSLEVRQAQETARRATRRADLAEQTRDFLIDLFSAPSATDGAEPPTQNPLAPDPPIQDLREIISRGATKAREELSDYPQMKADVLESLGSALLRLEDYRAAEILLEEAHWTWRSELGQEALPTIRSGCLAASAVKNRDRPDRALARLKEILPLARARIDPEHPSRLLVKNFNPERKALAACLKVQADVLIALGQTDLAQAASSEALDLLVDQTPR